MEIELTDKDRLLLANQFEILGLLKKDNYYLLKAEALRDGHKWLYRDLNMCEVLPDSSAEHVLTILGIYSDLRDSYNKLTDKSGIDEHEVVFPGFDGNNESELLSFAEALRKDGRFSNTLGTSSKNSHHPTTDIYSRMIYKHSELGKLTYPYSKHVIRQIIDAMKYPDN